MQHKRCRNVLVHSKENYFDKHFSFCVLASYVQPIAHSFGDVVDQCGKATCKNQSKNYSCASVIVSNGLSSLKLSLMLSCVCVVLTSTVG